MGLCGKDGCQAWVFHCIDEIREQTDTFEIFRDRVERLAIAKQKDEKRMNPIDCIREEKAEGRAKHVLYFPRWMVKVGFGAIKFITGKNKYTYLLNKAVNPLRTE